MGAEVSLHCATTSSVAVCENMVLVFTQYLAQDIPLLKP